MPDLFGLRRIGLRHLQQSLAASLDFLRAHFRGSDEFDVGIVCENNPTSGFSSKWTALRMTSATPEGRGSLSYCWSWLPAPNFLSGLLCVWSTVRNGTTSFPHTSRPALGFVAWTHTPHTLSYTRG